MHFSFIAINYEFPWHCGDSHRQQPTITMLENIYMHEIIKLVLVFRWMVEAIYVPHSATAQYTTIYDENMKKSEFHSGAIWLICYIQVFFIALSKQTSRLILFFFPSLISDILNALIENNQIKWFMFTHTHTSVLIESM